VNGIKLRIKKLWSVLDMRGPETIAYSLAVFITQPEGLFVFCKVTGSGWLEGTATGARETILRSGENKLGNQAVLNHAEDYVSMLAAGCCAVKLVFSE